MDSRLDVLGTWSVAVLGATLCVLAALITLDGSQSDFAWLEAIGRAAQVGVPIAVGLYAHHLPPFRRFGTLLIIVGFGWFFASLAGSADEVVYSVGRISGWLVEVGLVYVMLAFPAGRLSSRVDRLLVGAVVVTVVAFYLPTALLTDGYPVPSPWTTCSEDCPANAFQVVSPEPAWVEDVVRPVREVLTVALFGAATLRLGLRLPGASRLTRRTLWPVVAVACARFGTFALTIALRRAIPDSDLVAALAWLLALAVPAIAFAFLIGLVRWRLFIASSVQRLAARLRGHPRPEDLRAALADAFDDPTLEVVYRAEDDAGWTDAEGRPVQTPPPERARSLTEVRDDSRAVAAIIHDAALREDQAFIDTATSYAVMSLDNHRLAAQAGALVREVRESRARIQASADDERRRIERDLHDGAQQRLVALRIKLELAAEESDGEPPRAALLRGLGTEVERALEEVRSLARGIYPAPLADRGLVEALRSAALQGALPTTVLAVGVGRYPQEIESAAYFCSLEALQNAGKHAAGATAAVIELADDGELRVEVRDDGAGFDPTRVSAGMGFSSMRDRIAAVGGALTIQSRPGGGTRVSAIIPLEVKSPARPTPV
jgi:signal transduction histidine kinase